MDKGISNIYGRLPPELAVTPAGVLQFSPLLPGALDLAQCAAHSLQDMTMLAPAGTIERRYALALALQALVPGAMLTVMAPKDKGGARLKQELYRFGCEVSEEARRHFRICTTQRPAQLTGIDEALAEGAMRLIEPLGFWSQPGIFSWDRFDSGSALLLQHLPALSGRGADLGCGFGYLSRAILAAPAVAHLTLIDIDRRAIACARRNIADPRAGFLWADATTPQAELNHLDFIVTNPPFHDSGIENRALGQAFIERARGMLRPGGVCYLTANRHLPYEELLTRFYKSVTLKADENGFKIYHAIA